MGERERSDASPDEPKLVVDEDWKTQVQREKEQARQGPAPTAKGGDVESAVKGEQVAPERQPEPEQTREEDVPPPPPATFETMVAMLATQAMVALGHGPDPSTGKPEVRKDYARHAIDMLALLEEKTRGNLSGEEAEMLSGTLHQLRMLFVNVSP